MKIKLFPILTVMLTLGSAVHLLLGYTESSLTLAVIAVAFAVLATTEN